MAFGNYSMHITEAESFFRNVVAGKHLYTVNDIQEVLLSRITQPMTDFLAKSGFSYAEIDANRTDIANAIQKQVIPIFTDLGFELIDFRIEGTNFDDATQGRIDRITDMKAEAQALAAVGVNYAQSQQLEAMRDVARSDGPASQTMGMGIGMGAGMGFGQMMAGAFQGQQGQPQQQQQQQQPPPQQAAPAADDPMEKLKKLKVMFENELIDEAEFKAKKAEILAEM